MDNQDKPSLSLAELSLDDLMLEPLEGQPEAAPAEQAPCPHAAKFQVDTRGKTERRQLDDRRNAVRFEEPRRTGKDRRPGKNPWAPGVDI